MKASGAVQQGSKMLEVRFVDSGVSLLTLSVTIERRESLRRSAARSEQIRSSSGLVGRRIQRQS